MHPNDLHPKRHKRILLDKTRIITMHPSNRTEPPVQNPTLILVPDGGPALQRLRDHHQPAQELHFLLLFVQILHKVTGHECK